MNEKKTSGNILIVDDDTGILHLTEHILKMEGYSTRTAVTGLDCMKAIREDKPDLLLLDVILPDTSGTDICKKIKSDPSLSFIHIILLSGTKTEPDHVAEGLETGADGYLLKPFKNKEFLARVEAAFRTIRAEKNLRAMKARTEAILTAVPDIIMEVDTNKVYTWANQAGHQFFGDDVIGKEAAFYFEGEQQVYSIVQPLFEGNEEIFYLESWQRRRDGEKRLLGWWCRVLKDETGRVSGALSTARDITEQRQVVEALRESDTRFKRLAAQVPGMIYQFMMKTDKTFCVSFTTEGIRDIFGCSPEDVVNDFSPIAKVILPEDFEKVVSSIKYSAEHLTLWQCEYRVQIPGKPVRWMLGNSTPEKSADGSITWYGFNTDITERKSIENFLKESEQKFRSIFEESPIGIEIYDARGFLVSSNKASQEMFGIPDNSSAGFNLFEGTSLNEDLVRKLQRGETIAYQATFDFDRVRELDQYHTTRSGKAEMDYIINPLRLPGKEDLRGYLLQVQDITERKNAENIQRVVYDISNAVVTTRDLKELIGIIREQLGKLVDTTNFYVAFYDDTTGMLSTPYAQDQKDRLEIWPATGSLTGYVIRQGSPIVVNPDEIDELIRKGIIEMVGVPAACWLGVPLRMEGKIIGAFVIQSYDNIHAFSLKDVHILEFVSDQISLSIQRKIAEQDLIKAKEKAEESDRLKSAFLANMSHEIRTPMNAIVGFAGMMSEHDITDEERARFSAIIQSRSDDLMHIINDLLEISRIESGNANVVRERICMNTIVDEMEAVYAQRLISAKKTGLVLLSEKKLTDSETFFSTDGYIIKQVYSNLIDNAIKYTESGSIRFGYQKPENGMITCYVSDTGIGVASDHHQVIFESFRQADTSDQNRYGGTGLGLSICKGALALIGGNIWLESIPGEGSTFLFKVPFEPAGLPHHEPAQVEKKAAANVKKNLVIPGKRIMLVEDEESNMEYMTILLKDTGAEITAVFSGGELRALFPHLDLFDLVLLDIRLPDASGWELAKEIKKIRPDLPVIAQTAYAMQSDRKKSEEAGCNGYLSKPILRRELFQVIEKVIRKP